MEQHGGELLVAGKHGGPLSEGEIRGDDGAPIVRDLPAVLSVEVQALP